MYLSVFEIFKIGVGPSSSHTVGPMIASRQFVESLKGFNFPICRLRVSLHGSLAFTGKGHASDRAILLGLAGIVPESYDRVQSNIVLEGIFAKGIINIDGIGTIQFDPKLDLIFDYEHILPGHANGMRYIVLDNEDTVLFSEIYYSTGGGFVTTESELANQSQAETRDVPYKFRNSSELIQLALGQNKSIASIIRENEYSLWSVSEFNSRIENIWNTMEQSIMQGVSTDGILPGGLNVRRRAKDVYEKLMAEKGRNILAPHIINDWISTYAIAVNEENASGGRIVTAPTNGAAGVVPATLKYYLEFVPDASSHHISDYLLTASAIGGIIKSNASISGAECGCQSEVGSASAMAAAGLCAVLGGTPQQVENAAEIALEHHLGMTCDPIGGLVQIPCIERNGMGAIKAVSAASLSLRGDGTHFVSLDSCIETLRQTGQDMNTKYKETSLGGLAVNVANC